MATIAATTLERADVLSEQFIFLNAWNDWGNQAVLEPDVKNGYGYLNAVRDTLLHVPSKAVPDTKLDTDKLSDADEDLNMLLRAETLIW